MPGTTHAPVAPHRDRSRRLTVFGILTLFAGGGCLLFGGLYLLLPFAGTALPSDVAGVELRPALVGATTYALLGAVLFWAGVGALRRRRWVRSVMLVLAWTWLFAGILVLLLSLYVIDDMLEMATVGGPALPAEVALLVKSVFLAGTALVGIIVPLLYLWAFRDPDIELTCAAHDPLPSWSERCPLTVLGLSLGLAAAALFALPLAIQAAVPLFGRVVTGWPGALLTLAGAGVCAWLARATFRLERAGWWGSLVLMSLLGLSCAVTFQVAGLDEMLRGLGHPEDQLAMFRGPGQVVALWGTVGLTLLTVAYLVSIRHHFSSNTR